MTIVKFIIVLMVDFTDAKFESFQRIVLKFYILIKKMQFVHKYN